MDSSDDDIDDAQATTVHNFHDLESFQKAQLLNKVIIPTVKTLAVLVAALMLIPFRMLMPDSVQLRQTWIAEKNAAAESTSSSQQQQPKRRREFVLNNKAPLWNEHSQVYQLDFGGRVTQESAKNFQIEFKGKQVF